ncbi:hypothetical protein C2S51_021933 [Perilla frutescens var. frutescens]|nr:hypothetical protein C2S51_021933 [Perilla frutescens var. frutescens]
MAEAVVSIALQTLRDLLIEKGKLLFAVAGEVKALQTQLKEIKCFLEDADKKQHESKIVRNWIVEIRDLAYRSEDVVAEYSVRMSSASSSSSDGWGRRLLHRFSGVRHSSLLYQLSSEMLLIKSELARITKAMEGYGINRVIDGAAISGDNQNLARKAFPNFEIGECFVGKEEDLKRLVSLVVDDKEHRVISVWGMGGIGKTTIAKKVYNQIKEAKNSCFDCFVWVCISQQCQIRTVLEDILKQMEGGSVSDLSDVQLNDRLCELQTNKRCLIVVDDLWQISHWNALKHAFPALDNLQSKILVTTRKQKVAEIGFSLQLGLLNMDEGLELLQKKAFPPGHIPADFQLDEIGKEMVKKCGYLPLAISLLGGVLSKRKSMAELMLVKENVSAYLFRGDGNIEGENEMHAVLNLSYEDLPYYLKPCFLYLGIFQEDEKIDAYKLYKRWIAQGMVSDEMIRGEETLVDIAELYLGELASRCMIQVEDNCDNISPKYWKCKLHDVVREFCLSAGKKEEFGVEVLEYRDGNFGSLLPAVSRSLNKTRHLAIHFEGEVQLEGGGDLTITTCERLRSLEMLKKWNLKRIQFPPESMIDLEKFKVLRELLIQNFSFEDPDPIVRPVNILTLKSHPYLFLKNHNSNKLNHPTLPFRDCRRRRRETVVDFLGVMLARNNNLHKLLASSSMGNSVGSFFSGVAQLIGKALGHPLDFLSGKSCSSVCTTTWDFICYIENFCVAQLFKFIMVAFLVYFVLLFLYLLFNLGVCQCICCALCHIVWAFFSTYVSALHYCCTCCLHKLRSVKRRRRRDVEESSSSSGGGGGSEDGYELAEMSTLQPSRNLEHGRSQFSKRKSYKDERLKRSLRPSSHRARVELFGNSVHLHRKNIHRSVDDHVRVTRSSKFSQQRSRHRLRTHHRR